MIASNFPFFTRSIASSPVSALVTDVFDVYRGDQIDAGKKSIAFAIRYRAPDRTLTTEDANQEQDRIIRRLEQQFSSTIRS